jgi:hypothetical protein
LDCTFAWASASQGLTCDNVRLIIDGGDTEDSLTKFCEVIGAQELTDILIKNFDFSLHTGDIFDASTVGSRQHAERCLLHASTTMITGPVNPGVHVSMIHCQVGTDSDPAFQVETLTSRGAVTTDAARYRTGGASDGERTNPLSWDMDTTVGNFRGYPGHALTSPAIAGWTDGDGSTAHTYRIYFASGSTQQDDDIWFDLVGPNDAATNSMGVRKTKRVAPETAAANHTTDGASAWTGADVGTKQYMEFTYTPDKPGPIYVVVHVTGDAGAAGHIYVDPVIEIDGSIPSQRQWISPVAGAQFLDGQPSAGGGGGVKLAGRGGGLAA